MNRSEKGAIIQSLQTKFEEFPHFYATNLSTLSAVETNALRRECFTNDVQLVVVKNTLLREALEKSGKMSPEIGLILKGNTAIMFCNEAKSAAKLIQSFQKKNANKKPTLKGAYVEESVYVGEEHLKMLVSIKSKNELLADVIALLQSPIKTVLSALKSGEGKLTGTLTTLKERAS